MTDSCPKLISPLWSALKKDSSFEDVQRQSIAISNDPRFFEICQKLPLAEISPLMKISEGESPQYMICAVTMNRLNNPICNWCLDKSDTSKLLVCAACRMTYYCNETCQKKDWVNASRVAHRDWCCNLNAKADDGPLRVAIVKLK